MTLTRLLLAPWVCFISHIGKISVFFFCKPETLDMVYLNRIYGQYWIIEAEGKLKADYAATQHYQEYGISDIAVLRANGQRQGVKLNDTGVELLTVFQEKPETARKGAQKMPKDVTTISKEAGQTEYSMIKPRKTTKVRVDQFVEEEKITDSSPYDAALNLLLDRNYTLKTLTAFGASLEEIAALLADAASESETPVQFLADVLRHH